MRTTFIKLFPIICLVAILVLTFSEPGLAQCPMCKMSAESNLKDGGTMGRGLNMGILFLLGLPYLLVGTLGYIWYKNKKNYDEMPDTK